MVARRRKVIPIIGRLRFGRAGQRCPAELNAYSYGNTSSYGKTSLGNASNV